MIFTLLAAQFGAAQEAIVVYEGAESNHFVEAHTGSSYSWKVLVGFSPDTEANPNDYLFTSDNGVYQIGVRWYKSGLYFLDVTETDQTGCTNRKALVVSVISNNRSIAFNSSSSSDCYNYSDNSFSIPVRILDDGGIPLDQAKFPVDVDFTVNSTLFSQQIFWQQQVLNVDSSWFALDLQQETSVSVQLLSAADKEGSSIPVASGGDVHLRSIWAIPKLEFSYADTLVKDGSYGNYQLTLQDGQAQNAVFNWWVIPAAGTSTDLETINGDVADILWDGGIGTYNLYASVIDGNGCLGDTITQTIEVQEKDPTTIPVFAGPDTLIGSCQPYAFNQVFPSSNEYSYSWNPVTNLDDPRVPNPVFTPGETTTYVFTVTTLNGSEIKDTVTINVAQIGADAGDDFLIEQGETAILDGSDSYGENLLYNWTTNNGVIVSGENTVNPIVSSAGTYYLDVLDAYGCSAIDSVVVSAFVYAPIANDDYDTTSYQTAVTIPVLANDTDPEGNLDPTSLSIVQYPQNGSVYINYDDYTISYTPEQGFIGDDVFEYQICNLAAKCDNANVYVFVTPVDFIIPEAFTPNNDGVNDYFEIKGIEYYEGNSLTVINRWGKKVYEAKNYGISTTPKFWDGKWTTGGGNEDLPTGTYFYVLDLGNDEKPIAGSVYIDR
ncbi:gliding motility-associated C-terminal domain-containing protein [uncultured Draconibacterium sp.]|uniref:T9SS type B sorting domain-containing protein n=1 Tax=uncultured Draconibacterium sp. TaxID=1573823 RepID=UPI003216957F